MSDKKKIVFVSGTPRSGSTLLMNIFCQNPDFYSTGTSGILEVLFTIRKRWNDLASFKAAPPEENDIQRTNVITGALASYFQHVEQSVVFEKSRGWPAFLELAELALGERPKVILCVRDLRDVLASFEKLYRKNNATRPVGSQDNLFHLMQTAIGRCQVLLNEPNSNIVGMPMLRIKDAITRGFRDCLYFVDYESLCKEPDKTMEGIYEFIGEEAHSHDFENVKQVTHEHDEWFNWGPDLHKIKSKVAWSGPQYKKVFDDTVKDAPFWRDIEKDKFWWTDLERRQDD